jgi:methylenetetrahydrofolate dehydrogenase (NADP+)/methenyltetrahydrofolate cyclohydrolase
MPAQLLNGSELAHLERQHLKEKLTQHLAAGHKVPGLAVIVVGSDPASQVYVNNKELACTQIGIASFKYPLPETTSQTELLQLIDELNHQDSIHGILVQLPLPKHIDERSIIEAIDPKKDVDGFHPYNVGRLAQRKPALRPCTPYGVMSLLKRTGTTIRGQHAVIVGASNIVGRPMALELLLAGATVTVCHKFTRDLPSHIERADILICAAGKPRLIKGEWIKPGAIVIDVGISRLADGSLQGDVEFEVAQERASWITPVPGGVGPMTVTKLMENTLTAAGVVIE